MRLREVRAIQGTMRQGSFKNSAREAGPFCHRGLPPDYLGLARTAWDARTNKASKTPMKIPVEYFPNERPFITQEIAEKS
jgi:hypothetical protein